MGYVTLQPQEIEEEGYDRNFKVIAQRRKGLVKISLFYDRHYKRRYFPLCSIIIANNHSQLFLAPTIWVD